MKTNMKVRKDEKKCKNNDKILINTSILTYIISVYLQITKEFLIVFTYFSSYLSGRFWVRQAQKEVVKMKNFDFSYWSSITPWGHVLSLKTFCRNPVLSWAIRYSVFQKVKFTSSFKFVCGTLFSTFWHLVVKFGHNWWF